MADEWYMLSREKLVQDFMIERIISNEFDPTLLEVYGLEIMEQGTFSKIRRICVADSGHRNLLKLKGWLRTILMIETHCLKGSYFSRRTVPTLAIAMVYDEDKAMWERLGLGMDS